MSAHTYLGTTIYVREDFHTNESLAVLSEAIHTLPEHNQNINIDDYMFVTNTDAYKHLYNQTNSVTPRENNMPQNTPVAYFEPQIEPMVVNGYNLVRIYVPAVSEDENELYDYVYNGLLPVLDILFGEDIVSIRTRAQIEMGEFESATEEILVKAPGKPQETKVQNVA